MFESYAEAFYGNRGDDRIARNPNAQTPAFNTSAPVAITSLNYDLANALGMIGGEAADAPQFAAKIDSGYVEVKFVNTGAVRATAVSFVLTNGDVTQRIVDNGTFRPGVPIQHTFAVRNLNALVDGGYSIAEVEFADGTVWHDLAGSPSAHRRLFSPNELDRGGGCPGPAAESRPSPGRGVVGGSVLCQLPLASTLEGRCAVGPSGTARCCIVMWEGLQKFFGLAAYNDRTT